MFNYAALWLKSIYHKDTDTKQTKSRWTYWSIYLQYGVEGSVWNLFYLNPIVSFLVVLEIIANSVSTFAMTSITKALMNKSGSAFESRYYFLLLLGFVLFATDITKFAKRLFRIWSLFYKGRILRRINKGIIDHLSLASFETKTNFASICEQFEALNQFVWTYDNVTDTLVDMVIQIARFTTFCTYIIYTEPRLIFVLCITYVILWRYIAKPTMQKKSGNEFYSRAYYDMLTKDNNDVNPLFKQIYQSFESNRCDMIVNDEYDYEHIARDEASFASRLGKGVQTDVLERYMELIHYYIRRTFDWVFAQDTVLFSQNVASFLIVGFLFVVEKYEIAMLVMINRSVMFGIMASYSDAKRCEQSSERSMEKIVKILNAIDTQIESEVDTCTAAPVQIVDSDIKYDLRVRLTKIIICNMMIPIPIPKTTSQVQSKVYPTMIRLDTTEILVEPHKCLLLDGRTGCGKSMTINILAGLYRGTVCDKMNVVFSDYSLKSAEFNQLLGSRVLISQLLADDYKYNGKIDLPIYKLFPGAKSIEQVSAFLKDVFRFKDSCIPTSLEETPHSRLSGGEIQRYVVATSIWQTIMIRPDIIIMDEIDKALDKETALHVVSWIVNNISSYFVIVSHLTEVKQMLFDTGYVNQVWTYDEETDASQIIIRTQLINFNH